MEFGGAGEIRICRAGADDSKEEEEEEARNLSIADNKTEADGREEEQDCSWESGGQTVETVGTCLAVLLGEVANH